MNKQPPNSLLETHTQYYRFKDEITILFNKTKFDTQWMISTKHIQGGTFAYRILVMNLIDNSQAKLCISTPPIRQI